LIERQPTARIAVLERGILPTGASTRNAGFACFGSMTELLADLKTMSEEELCSLVGLRWNGLRSLRQRLGDEGIGFENNGGYELISERELYCIERISEMNELLKPIFNANVFELTNEKIDDFGFSRTYSRALIRNHFEGQLDTGLMMQRLLFYVQRRGVHVYTGCKVERFEDFGDKVGVSVANPVDSDTIDFYANRLVVCTNAFTHNLIADIDIQAGRGQVLMTEPVENLRFKGVFHFDEGYFYFRNYQNRILFGGGRNLDFESEQTTDIALNDKIIQVLEDRLQTIIAPHQEVKIAHRWAGIMAFGKTKKPIIHFYSPRILVGVRMGGMGVAIGTEVGEILCKMLLEH
jgi:glycine/D-amino acid oxidase-like deaminating enzyme